MLDPRGAQRDVHVHRRVALDDALDVGRALDVDSALDVLSVAVVEFHDRRLAVGVADLQVLGLVGRRGIEILGQGDLDLPGHTDPDDSLVLRSTIVSRSPGPTCASTLPASAVSTVHAKVSVAGCCGARQAAVTAMVMTSWPSVNAHSRLAPGTAW